MPLSNDEQTAQVLQARRDVLAYLKPFQRKTVEHVDGLYRSGARRVLVADEVGLGKTLVAKGVVATTAALRKEENDPFFKVVYVCSNSAIVNQNLSKLSVDEDLVDRVDASNARLSMQHFTSYQNERIARDNNSYIQLIPLTPGTSFNVSNGQGAVRERALIFAVLRRFRLFRDLTRKLENMFMAPAPSSWRGWRDYYEREVTNEPGYIDKMLESLEAYSGSLREVADYLVNRKDTSDDRRWIGRIRRDFALLSVEHLDPDLVIMDEFQRFRDLLDTESDTDLSIIAKKFLFSETRKDDPVRILLLSATPFKPFSTSAEDETFFGDSAADDFLNLVSFLSKSSASQQDGFFKDIWKEYGIVLSQYVENLSDIAAVRIAKDNAEHSLRRLIARTERDGMGEYADIMKDCTANEHIMPETSDISAQLTVRRLFKRMGLDQTAPVEYAESCPYLLSYLKGYKLGDKLLKAVEKNIDVLPFKQENHKNARLLWIQSSRIARFEKLNIPNTRFERLMEDVFETGNNDFDASSLLWIPASRPYYTVKKGPFAGVKHFSKTLIFSSWTMVPRMASTLLSYEDERRSVAFAYEKGHSYSYFDKDDVLEAEDVDVRDDDAKKLPSKRLNIYRDAGKGPALLLYPSVALASMVTWPEYAEDATLDSMVKELAEQIREKLEKIIGPQRIDQLSGSDDLRWFLKATLLLEQDAGLPVDEFLTLIKHDESLSAPERRLADSWRAMTERSVNELGKIPEKLYTTLAKVALGSPAVCSMRMFNACAEHKTSTQLLAYRFSTALLRKLNTPSATLAVESGFKPGLKESKFATHWERVLEYCALGNLQAVLDEYAHQVGYHRRSDVMCAYMIGEGVGSFRGPSLYTMQSHYDVDTLQSLRRRAKDGVDNPITMRTGFAAAFIEDESGGNNTNRRENMRRAFNSPFRPFVLCSTSVGQEGLDFHAYCRKIVHWNLPGNPIDFEQREGRVNRYESLAIRQNVAHKHNAPLVPGQDIWKDMFDKLRTELEEHADGELAGLAPHWGLPHYDEDDVRIERHAYLRKFSQAEQRYERLIDVLVRYRAVLGQPRQEELLAKLGDKLAGGGDIHGLFMDLAPFNYEEE